MSLLAERLLEALKTKSPAGQGEASQPHVKRNGQMDITLDAKSEAPIASDIFTAAQSPERNRAERWLDAQFERVSRFGPFTVTAKLTPELAELLLAKNPDNRPLSEVKIGQYVRDIGAGNWRHNGETIIVAETGELNDGQHRCRAVIDAGRAIVTEMTFGVGRDTRLTVDTGIKRTIGRQLHMMGYPEANSQAHAAALIMVFNRTKRFAQLTLALRPTPSEVQVFVSQHDLHTHILYSSAAARKLSLSKGMAAAVHYLCNQKDPHLADAFFEALATGVKDGVGLKGGPIYRLRELLIAKGKKLSEAQAAEAIIRAWNAVRHNRSPRSLLLDDQPFPIPE